jgi:hypothetical protein
MTVRKIKSISPVSRSKPDEFELTLTTADDKPHRFKLNNMQLRDLIIHAGSAMPKGSSVGEGPVAYSVSFNQASEHVLLRMTIGTQFHDFMMGADLANSIGQELISAANHAREFRGQRPQ